MDEGSTTTPQAPPTEPQPASARQKNGVRI